MKFYFYLYISIISLEIMITGFLESCNCKELAHSFTLSLETKKSTKELRFNLNLPFQYPCDYLSQIIFIKYSLLQLCVQRLLEHTQEKARS